MQPMLCEEQLTGFEGKAPVQCLQELVDREQIRDLAACYAQRAAHGMSIADLFTDDGTFIRRFPSRPVERVHGRAALDNLFHNTAAKSERPLPTIHNHMVRIQGDEAAGACSIELYMSEEGKRMSGSGYYNDRLRREHGRWWFVVRDLTITRWVPIQQKSVNA